MTEQILSPRHDDLKRAYDASVDPTVDPTEARKLAGLAPADRVVRRRGNRAPISKSSAPGIAPTAVRRHNPATSSA